MEAAFEQSMDIRKIGIGHGWGVPAQKPVMEIIEADTDEDTDEEVDNYYLSGEVSGAAEYEKAVRHIADRVDSEGYGVLITHQEIDDLCKLKQPGIADIKEINDYNMKKMQAVIAIREALLKEHLLFIMNVQGIGYRVLTPDEQVEIAPESYEKKIRRTIHKSQMAITNVRVSELSNDSKKKQLFYLKKNADVLMTMRGRKKYMV